MDVGAFTLVDCTENVSQFAPRKLLPFMVITVMPKRNADDNLIRKMIEEKFFLRWMKVLLMLRQENIYDFRIGGS